MACLVSADRRLLAQQANPAQSGPAGTYEGILGVVWGDPHPTFGSASDIRYTLTAPDGRMQLLQLTGQENEAAAYFGKRVRVSGRQVQAQAVAAAGAQPASAIVVDGIALTPGAQAQADAFEASVLGTRKVIFLLVKFSDDAAVPHPPSFYTDMTNPITPPAPFPATLNGFFSKTSYGQFSWTADIGGVGGVGAPGGWLTLPNPKSYYAPCGFSTSCANLNALSDDATALGRAQGINFKVYNNINFVLSNDLDCCAWGGGYFSSVDGQSYGATWEPPWGQNVPTYAHEMGHSLGLPHSGWVYRSYDSPWDIMSDVSEINAVNCGSYLSANGGTTSAVYCSEPGDGYIAAHRDYLGWIPSANQVVTDTSSGITVTLEGASLAIGSAAKAIKICITGLPCTGGTAHYYTVEARVKNLGATSQFDNGIPNEGIIIHDVQMNRAPIGSGVPCYFNTQSGWAVPIDATPGDFNSAGCSGLALSNAQFAAGQTYTNGFNVRVLSRSGSTFVVWVTPQLTAPIAITEAASSVTGTTATLNGTANPNGFATNARFEYGLTTSYGGTTPLQAMGAGGSAASIGSGAIAGLTCGATYHFRATATSVNGTTTGSDSTFTTPACPLPTAVTGAAAGIGKNTATLNGTANPNGVDTSASFEYGQTAAYGGTTPAQAMGTGSSALPIGGGSIAGLACGTLYHFRATATNANGTGTGTDGTFTTTACSPPTVVTSAATTVTKTSAQLNGTANPNGVATSASFEYGPTISYGTTTPAQAIGSGAVPVSIGGGALAGLTCNTTYHFRAVATNADGPATGADLSFTTLACATPFGDLDGDGKSDLLLRNKSTGQDIGWLMNGLTVANSAFMPTIADTNWKIVGRGDFDGNGKADVLLRNSVTGQDIGWLMNGLTVTNSAFMPTIADTNWEIRGVGDFDGDGRSDVILRNKSTGQDIGWLMNGLTVTLAAFMPTIADTNWEIAGVGDFSGDGKADVILRNKSTGQNIGWLMNGLTVSNSALLPTIADTNWEIKGVGDFDGDGKADVVLRNKVTGQNIGWLMNGLTVTNSALLPTIADTNWEIKGVGDFDGDGKADVVLRNKSTGQNIEWRMNGLTVTNSALLPTIADTNWELVGQGQ